MDDANGASSIAFGHGDGDGSELLSRLRNGAWLDAQTFPPLTYAVPGVIPEGLTLLVGPPKIGKSWLALACALTVAVGGCALGCLPVDKRPVLYLALEDGDRRLQDRCRTLLGDDPIPARFEYLTSVTPTLVIPTIGQWLQRHSDAGPLVMLDTLGKVMPSALPGESAYMRDYRIGGTLKRLADQHTGSSLVTNHHDRKAGSDDFVDSVSGTHGLAGAADTIITLTRARHDTSGVLRVTGRDVAEGEYALTFDAGAAWRLDGDTLATAESKAAKVRATVGVGDRMAEVIAHVSDQAEPTSPAELARAMHLPSDQAGIYLRRAVEMQRLRRVGRGLYTSF